MAYTYTEKLANTERHLDVAKTHSQRADDKTDELKQLNRSIFRPVITFNKDAKRAAKESEIQRRYEEDRDQRERTMIEVRESQNRIGRAGGVDDGEGIGGRRGMTETQLAMRKEQRKRYQFEETASDDELEDELDDNLSEIGDVAKRLKNLGMAMGQELDQQNSRIDRLGDKAGGLDQRLFSTTERVCGPYIYRHSRCLLARSCSSSASSRRSVFTSTSCRLHKDSLFSSDFICTYISHIVHSWTASSRNTYT